MLVSYNAIFSQRLNSLSFEILSLMLFALNWYYGLLIYFWRIWFEIDECKQWNSVRRIIRNEIGATLYSCGNNKCFVLLISLSLTGCYQVYHRICVTFNALYNRQIIANSIADLLFYWYHICRLYSGYLIFYTYMYLLFLMLY